MKVSGAQCVVSNSKNLIKQSQCHGSLSASASLPLFLLLSVVFVTPLLVVVAAVRVVLGALAAEAGVLVVGALLAVGVGVRPRDVGQEVVVDVGDVVARERLCRRVCSSWNKISFFVLLVLCRRPALLRHATRHVLDFWFCRRAVLLRRVVAADFWWRVLWRWRHPVVGVLGEKVFSQLVDARVHAELVDQLARQRLVFLESRWCRDYFITARDEGVSVSLFLTVLCDHASEAVALDHVVRVLPCVQAFFVDREHALVYERVEAVIL